MREIVYCSNTVLNKKCNACKFCSQIKLVSTLVKSLESSGFNLLLSDHINVENLLTDTTNPSTSVSSTGNLNNSNNKWNCKLEVPVPETLDDDCYVTENVQNGRLSGTQQQETRNPTNERIPPNPSTNETSKNRRSVFIPSSAVPGPSTSTRTPTPPNFEISSDDEVLSKTRKQKENRNIERSKM
ncbi:unnamed protein product [Colias eurytheme]|nr:unnamed protein product [Colias eurytheme]